MADGNEMPKVDFEKQGGSIDKRTRQLMDEVDVMNKTRLQRLTRMRKNAKVTAGLISAAMLGIYAYSMYAVRQETFLDVLDEEVRQQKSKQA
ncbi:cytochrome c oxidase assembly factor 3, mitochondrial-like [Pollicipes pollicipes]|uniref:cytochrome c oxidase assembly factor 3, mitochondrial-like n=1 Tax=Pollicipes pollicipes TaxID=41117 RepID=UPI001884D472|nr:cytochrome c oxidase assembly factor 3, mitochondrial-like [Pollicipes pollicipes]